MNIEIDTFEKEDEYKNYISLRGYRSGMPLGWRPSVLTGITSNSTKRHNDDSSRLNNFATELQGSIFWTATRYEFLKKVRLERFFFDVIVETYAS